MNPFKRSRKSRRSISTKKWLDETDPIKRMTYYVLVHVKILLIILVTYLFVQIVSDILFTIENTGDIAKGNTQYYFSQNPKINI